MRATKRFDLYRLPVVQGLEAWAAALAQMLESLFLAINSIAFGTPVHQTRAPNVDGVWLVVTFTAANTDTRIAHNLGRTPVGLFQAEVPLLDGGSLIDAHILFKSASVSEVVLQSTVVNKRAAVFLF